MRFQRSLPVLATPLLAVVLLTGCGVAGTDFHPGVAAQVGDDTITTRHVDEVAEGYCGAIEAVTGDQPDAEQQLIPMRYLTHEFAYDLVIRAAAEQLAEDYGVEAGPRYREAVAGLEPQLEELSDEQRDAVLEVEGAQAYYQDVLTSIGELELAGQGSGDTEPTDEDKFAEGQRLLTAWVGDHDVEINPKYGLEFGAGGQIDTDLSFPLGDTAKAGLAAQPDDTYAGALPAHLVCGG